jgi:outer membrane protein OmpA-like peptidoglycan-associated protein
MRLKSSWSNKLLYALALLLPATAMRPQDSLRLQPGSKAPSFIMNVEGNSIRSITWPYMKRIVLVHFWSPEMPLRTELHHKLNALVTRYRSASYRNAEGFDVIAIAVHNDKAAWTAAMKEDSLGRFINGIAHKGMNDEVCRKFGVSALPSRMLVDEEGIVIAVDPRLSDIEFQLDERRNFQPVRKPIGGKLALSTDKNEALRYGRVFLFNSYGDSLSRGVTSENGGFSFDDVKLNQDLLLKVDNKIDINTSDPISLYTDKGEFVMDGRTRDEGFVFYLPARMNSRMVRSDSSEVPASVLGEINVIKSLSFREDGYSLAAHDQQELGTILVRLKKNPDFRLELITHTDSRLEQAAALELSAQQAQAIKSWFEKSGIASSRIKAVAKGNSEPRKLCVGTADCREEDYRMNRRVEFIVFRD